MSFVRLDDSFVSKHVIYNLSGHRNIDCFVSSFILLTSFRVGILIMFTRCEKLVARANS